MNSKIKRENGFSIIELLLLLLVAIIVIGVSIYIFKHVHKTTPTSSSTGTISTIHGPTIPDKGSYLGAWVNPGHGTGIGGTKSDEIANLKDFNTKVGKPVAIIDYWSGFKTAVPTAALNSIAQNGSVPLLNWGCSDVTSISSGSEDSIINNYADGLKSYGKPVFLRWYWEFNEMSPAGKTPAGSGCNGYNNGQGYISAWQHIYTKFQEAGVKNVSFVWCPGYSGGNFASYYPGDKYVDWIGIDRYERTTNGKPLLSFTDMFSSYYNEWSSHNKPIFIAETAAMGSSNQSQYLTSMLNEAHSFPNIKAISYFDSIGPAGDWSLTGEGITAYQNLNNSPYFSYKSN